jgi:polyhydroxyalkanoate synthesis regulator phasin
MSRHPRYASDLDLLDAVRVQLATDPDISRAELRARIGGTQTVVSAAHRAALVEAGRSKPGECDSLDPRFAGLIRIPGPPPPLDLWTAVPGDLAQDATKHLATLTDVVNRTVARIHEAALEAIRVEAESGRRLIDDADRRAGRAEAFVDSLQREIAEATAETERVRARAAEEQVAQGLELARLTRELADALGRGVNAEQHLRSAVAEHDQTRAALAVANDERVVMARDLAASCARVDELERRVTELAARLERAGGDLAAARAAESESRAAAAAAMARLEVQGAVRNQTSRRRGIKGSRPGRQL